MHRCELFPSGLPNSPEEKSFTTLIYGLIKYRDAFHNEDTLLKSFMWQLSKEIDNVINKVVGERVHDSCSVLHLIVTIVAFEPKRNNRFLGDAVMSDTLQTTLSLVGMSRRFWGARHDGITNRLSRSFRRTDHISPFGPSTEMYRRLRNSRVLISFFISLPPIRDWFTILRTT